eukprot:scaffold874_cov380-Prasinococcus_capsulatus_cf.AAC.2
MSSGEAGTGTYPAHAMKVLRDLGRPLAVWRCDLVSRQPATGSGRCAFLVAGQRRVQAVAVHAECCLLPSRGACKCGRSSAVLTIPRSLGGVQHSKTSGLLHQAHERQGIHHFLGAILAAMQAPSRGRRAEGGGGGAHIYVIYVVV